MILCSFTGEGIANFGWLQARLDEDYHMSRVHMMVSINGIRRVKWQIWVLVLGLRLNVPMEK